MLSPRASPWERYHGDLTSASPPRPLPPGKLEGARRQFPFQPRIRSRLHRPCAQIFAFAHEGPSPLPSAGGAYLTAGGAPKAATDTDKLMTNNDFQQMGWVCDMTPGVLEARDDPMIAGGIPPALLIPTAERRA